MNRFLTCFIATHVSILTSDTSTAPSGTASTAYGTLLYRFRRRMTEDGERIKPILPPVPLQTLQHPGNGLVFVPPFLPLFMTDVFQVQTIA